MINPQHRYSIFQLKSILQEILKIFNGYKNYFLKYQMIKILRFKFYLI